MGVKIAPAERRARERAQLTIGKNVPQVQQSAQTLMSKYLSNWAGPEAMRLVTAPPEISLGVENLGLVMDLAQSKMYLPQERCLSIQAQLKS